MCEFQSQTKQDMMWHKKSEHGIATFPCELCEYVGKYPVALKNHKVKNHGYTIINFPCNKCKYKARSEAKLDQHMEKHGSESNTKTPIANEPVNEEIKEEPGILTETKPETNLQQKKSTIACTLCHFKTFKQIKLFQHIQSLHSENKFNCKKCEYATKYKVSLKNHTQSVHNNSKKDFLICDNCDFTTKFKMRLKTHVKTVHEVSVSEIHMIF